MIDSERAVEGTGREPEQAAQTETGEQAQPTPGAPAPGGNGAAARGPGGDAEGAGRSRAADPGDGAAEIEGDLDELVRTAAQRDEYLALAQRTQADFENYRKRVAREAAVAREKGAALLAKELLPALDNLDRALGAAAADDPLLEGVRLVRDEISAALGRSGIDSFRPLDEAFDPNLHEAVATAEQPPEGGAASGTVVEVFQDGYRMGEHVIRPARVVVAA